MSASRTVPAGVPSLVQGSFPAVPSFAAKKSRLPIATRPEPGEIPPVAPAKMSFTIVVPAAVPSLRHSSRPAAAVVAVK